MSPRKHWLLLTLLLTATVAAGCQSTERAASDANSISDTGAVVLDGGPASDAASAGDSLDGSNPRDGSYASDASVDAKTDAADDALTYRAIIIGSGYGGSVAALRLGEHDVETLVLERGRDWTIKDPKADDTFATMDQVVAGDPAMNKTTWMLNRVVGNFFLVANPPVITPTTGVLEYVDDLPSEHHDLAPRLQMKGVRALVAAGVGGGSLINNGITYAPTEAGFKLAFPDAELPHMKQVWQQLKASYFARAMEGLAPEKVPADLLARPEYAGTRIMDTYFASLGYPDEDAGVAETFTYGKTIGSVIVDYDKVREETTGARVPSVIKGEAWWGNNSGARKSLDTADAYLGRAVKTGKVTVKPLHTVTEIDFDETSKLYTVTAVETDLDYKTLHTFVFKTPHLIMAAGSLGTTKLLIRAKATGKLPKLNQHLGTRWSTNGNMAHLRLTFAPEPPLGQGGTAGVKITDFQEPNNPVVMENLPQRAPPVDPAAQSNAPQDALLMIGIGIPKAKGTFSFDAANDTVVLDWPADGAKNVYDRVTAIFRTIFDLSLMVELPMERSMQNTLHPLGGVPFGLATNLRCGLEGYEGLYAVDGSIMPGPAAVTNPSFLITSMAERCMDRIIEDVTGAKLDYTPDAASAP